jgi:hypothetical protein
MLQACCKLIGSIARLQFLALSPCPVPKLTPPSRSFPTRPGAALRGALAYYIDPNTAAEVTQIRREKSGAWYSN